MLFSCGDDGGVGGDDSKLSDVATLSVPPSGVINFPEEGVEVVVEVVVTVTTNQTEWNG